MSLSLRDYQIECVDTVLAEYSSGIKRQIISLPTGSGKTVVMASIAKQLNKKTLLLAHREELLTQSIDKFKLFWPNVDIGLCKAEYNEIHNQVVVGSVQTCCRPNRLDSLREQGFELLLIDEAHHSVSDSYQSIINALGFANGSHRLMVGVTATPMRSDKQGLGDIFEKLVFSRSIATMIRGNYLSPVAGRKILTNFSFDRIKTKNGDFDLGELAEAVNTSERNAFIASKFKEYASSRKGVAFCVDVQHCKDLSNAFREAGINSMAVYGDMPAIERKNVLDGLKSGKFQVVTSCGILVEGFDEPSIDVVIMARPTKSPGLYIQCVGRGLRLWPGKENCYVLDFTDRGHNLDTVMTLSNTIPEAIHVKEEDEGEEIEREEIDRTPKINVIESCDHEFDILGAARFIWVQVGDEWSLQDDDKREIVMSPADGGYVATLYYLDGSSKQIVNKPLPLEYCSGVCEDYARRHLKIAYADARKPWMLAKAAPSQGQRDFLEKQHKYKEGMTRGEASIEIRKIIALKNKQRRLLMNESATLKQIYFLKQHGIDATDMNKFEAMREIGKLKKAG
jgi:superfamily II DNA or RNA helicase